MPIPWNQVLQEANCMAYSKSDITERVEARGRTLSRFFNRTATAHPAVCVSAQDSLVAQRGRPLNEWNPCQPVESVGKGSIFNPSTSFRASIDPRDSNLHMTIPIPPPSVLDSSQMYTPPALIPSDQSPLRIAVGSTNRAKMKSVEFVAQRLFAHLNRPIDVHGYQVQSQVSAQPMSDGEAIEGAICRAKQALREDPQATFAVGLEGGAQKIGDRWFESGWIAVLDRHGKIGLGSSGRFRLSDKIVNRLITGEELAEVMDDLSGLKDVRSTDGAMGLITNGHVSRDVAYSHGVFFAFGQHISDPVYWD